MYANHDHIRGSYAGNVDAGNAAPPEHPMHWLREWRYLGAAEHSVTFYGSA